MSDVAADALVVKGEILVEYAKPYGLNRNPNVNLASLGIIQGVSSLRSLSPCTCVEVFEWYGRMTLLLASHYRAGVSSLSD